MKSVTYPVVAAAAGLIACAGLVGFAAPQQTQTGGASGTPSTQPRPGNSQPRPIGSPSTVPQPTPAPAPATTPAGAQPGTTTTPATQPPAGAIGVIQQDGSSQVVTGVDNRYQRPFVFQSPAYEGRFADYSRRLVAMESRLARSNADLTRRLGEARAMTGERQQTAIFDILQQMLKEQAALNQYLVRARTAWSGDLEGTVPFTEDELWASGQQQGVTPGAPTNTVPATTPNNTVPANNGVPAPTDTIPAKPPQPR